MHDSIYIIDIFYYMKYDLTLENKNILYSK